MSDRNADSSKDWPTLSDSNNAFSSTSRNKLHDNSKYKPKIVDSTSASAEISEKETSEVNPDVSVGATGFDNERTSVLSNKTGARRKTKWSPAPINVFSYKDNRSGRRYNDSHRFVANSPRFSKHESTNNVNGHERSSGRGLRGGRDNTFQSRRENAVNSYTLRDQRGHQEDVYISKIRAEYVDGSLDETEAVKEQLMRQIEYYFSEENLVRDRYLRCRMDEQGYVQLSLIAYFPRITRLTDDMQLILEAVKKSINLEVSDNVKVRPAVDPLRWPIKEFALKEINGGAASVAISVPFVGVIYSPFYNMPLYHTVYQHFPQLNPHWPGKPISQAIPVDYQDKNSNVFYMGNGIYPPVDANGLSVSTNNSNIPNGHACSPEQLSSPNFDLKDEFDREFDELVREFTRSNEDFAIKQENWLMNLQIQNRLMDLQIQNSASFFPLRQIHCEGDSYVFSNIADNFKIDSGASASTSTEALTTSNGLACSLDPRRLEEIYAYNCYFGQISYGVITYNSGGHYYVANFNQFLADSADLSEDISTAHNKSSEPSK